MTAGAQGSLHPRKRPVQARSEATVHAIFEASIQVLLSVGYRKLTTSRVAERAGVSVGTLYQYFPNRQSLIGAVLERYPAGDVRLDQEAHRQSLQRRPLDETAAGLVDALLHRGEVETTRSLHRSHARAVIRGRRRRSRARRAPSKAPPSPPKR